MLKRRLSQGPTSTTDSEQRGIEEACPGLKVPREIGIIIEATSLCPLAVLKGHDMSRSLPALRRG